MLQLHHIQDIQDPLFRVTFNEYVHRRNLLLSRIGNIGERVIRLCVTVSARELIQILSRAGVQQAWTQHSASNQDFHAILNRGGIQRDWIKNNVVDIIEDVRKHRDIFSNISGTQPEQEELGVLLTNLETLKRYIDARNNPPRPDIPPVRPGGCCG